MQTSIDHNAQCSCYSQIFWLHVLFYDYAIFNVTSLSFPLGELQRGETPKKLITWTVAWVRAILHLGPILIRVNNWIFAEKLEETQAKMGRWLKNPQSSGSWEPGTVIQKKSLHEWPFSFISYFLPTKQDCPIEPLWNTSTVSHIYTHHWIVMRFL